MNDETRIRAGASQTTLRHTYSGLAGTSQTWSGKTNQVAVRIEDAWEYHVPQPGWIAYIVAEDKLSVYKSTGWSAGVTP